MGPSQGTTEERVVAYRVKFSGRAAREVGEAYEWYEAQSQGLGSEFEVALELQLKRLEQVPLLYAEVFPRCSTHIAAQVSVWGFLCCPK